MPSFTLLRQGYGRVVLLHKTKNQPCKKSSFRERQGLREAYIGWLPRFSYIVKYANQLVKAEVRISPIIYHTMSLLSSPLLLCSRLF